MYDGEGVLEHRSRKLIYNYILTNPGATFGAIKQFLDLNTSTLTYHLNYMERARKIFSRREGNNKHYFCASEIHDQAPRQLQPGEPGLTEKQRFLLNHIQGRPGITKDELQNSSRLNRKNLNYNLNRLIDMNLIWLVKNDGVVGYEYITPEELRSEMIKKLVAKLIADEIDEETFNRVMKKLESLDIDEI
jgi:predicted transcriptional regulator